MFSYDHLIDEEYEKRRESVMRYTKNDVVRTTKIMDLQAESDVLWMYTCYLNTAVVDSQNEALDDHGNSKSESVDFYEGLWKEVYSDFQELGKECREDDVMQMRHEDGTWETTEVVWVTKDGSMSEVVQKVDAYRSAHNARLASARTETLPLPEILVPDDLDSDFTVPVWKYQPLGPDIAAPIVMGMIFRGKLEAVYGSREEDIYECNDDVDDVD